MRTDYVSRFRRWMSGEPPEVRCDDYRKHKSDVYAMLYGGHVAENECAKLPDFVFMQEPHCPTTVGELQDALATFPRDKRVIGTWEGVTRDISVYQAHNGTVMIDADDCFYQPEFQNGDRLP